MAISLVYIDDANSYYMEICSRVLVIPNGLVWLAVPYFLPTHCNYCTYPGSRKYVGDSTAHCKWPGCAVNGVQSAPGHLTAMTPIIPIIMLHSTGRHQIRLLLYICAGRILITVWYCV